MHFSFDKDGKGLEAAKAVLAADNSSALCERFADILYDEFNSDDEPFHKKGYQILQSYISGTAEERSLIDSLLASLTGWSLPSLLKRARLMDDDDNTFHGEKADFSDCDEDDEDQEEGDPAEEAFDFSKIDWIIHYVSSGVACDECGKSDDEFIQYACNAHTHGMEKYGHKDFQVVISLSPNVVGYILNELGKRVQSGKKYKAGDMVSGIFEDCNVRLDDSVEDGHKVLRVVIPDSKNRFPEDPECEYPYSFQTLPLEQLYRSEGGDVH